jgi:peptidyl-tRNA hydrolase, PTH1 family
MKSQGRSIYTADSECTEPLSDASEVVRRARLGIGHPGDKALVHSFVLNDFSKADMGWVEAVCRAVADAAPLLVEGKDASFQNKTHLAIEAAGFGEKGES